MEERRIKILLLVPEPWRNDDSGGNTINNFFSGFEAEFAQIFCSARKPENDKCFQYFQITELEVVRNFISHREVGHEFNIDNECENLCDKSVYSKSMVGIRKTKFEIFRLAKRILWRYSNWKTKNLETFITDFDPDVIYAPCYSSPFLLELTRYVKDLTHKKVVTWSADDNYSLRQFSLSPSFWIGRLWTRRCLKKTYPLYDYFYSASEDEIEELKDVVNKDIHILRKTAEVAAEYNERCIHQPIKMIYAGGLYCNRWKSIAKLCEAIRRINKDDIKVVIHIYSISELTNKQYDMIHDGVSCFLHKPIDKDALDKAYKDSDIAIHCESFDLKYRLITRLSFSTKIIDCMQSGCAILAIAWKEHTGLKYLKKEDAAICIDNIKQIDEAVEKLVKEPQIIKEYAFKAYRCAKKNHDQNMVQKQLYNTFVELCE